jgi:hyperosmotically inducible protein
VVIGSSRIDHRPLVRAQSRTLNLTLWRYSTLRKIALTLVLSSALLGLGTITMAQESKPVAPDNSAVNARDRDPNAMTAGEQSSAKSDIELTREIRQAVVKDDSLSMLAHNVKIIAANGAVTLRGPVKTEQEKVAIASKAQAIAGAIRVDDQLEVKGQ